jgi:hypothetical protein
MDLRGTYNAVKKFSLTNNLAELTVFIERVITQNS